jgi:hypothetical protein
MVNGEVYAWGSNMQGQLGMSAGGSSGGYRLWRVGSDSPQGPFSGLSPLPKAIGASCGSKHTLVWSQGVLWLFGANSKGQLGSAPGPVNDFNGVPIAKTLCSLANLCPPKSDQFRISFAGAQSLHPKHSNLEFLNPQPSTLNPTPEILHPGALNLDSFVRCRLGALLDSIQPMVRRGRAEPPRLL